VNRLGIRSAVVVAAGAALFTVAAVAATFSNTPVLRVERAIVNSWNFGCIIDSCQGGPRPFPAITVQTPDGADQVNVVVSVTMDYRTTRGDHGIVRMQYAPEGGGPATDMRPDRFFLNSSGVLTSTTLTWIAKNVPAAGASYDFSLLALPRGEDNRFMFSGHRFTAVIEMWAET
jgi:hypothetical protein